MSRLRFIPTIDIYNGQAVLVKNGVPYKQLGCPLKLAEKLSINPDFQVVDLNRAMGDGHNNKAIIKEISHKYTCYVSGGIRTLDDATEMLNASAKRVVISTAATCDFLSKLPPQRKIVAFDIDEKYNVFKHGRKELTTQTLFEKLDELAPYISMICITFHHKEGTNEGLPFDQVNKIMAHISTKKYVNMELIVAGGINSIEQIEQLFKCGVVPQFGSGFWLGNFTLGDVYCALLNKEKQSLYGKIGDYIVYPCAIINKRGQLLGIVYTTAETLKETIDTRNAVFFSRDRMQRWCKGDTSGDRFTVHQVVFNCDRTSLSYIVDGNGHVFCHTGSESCFRNRDPCLSGLLEIENHLKLITSADTITNSQSYTQKIFQSKYMIYSKILEETHELWCAYTKKGITWETADLLYFIILNLIKNGIAVSDVINELTKRRYKVPLLVDNKVDDNKKLPECLKIGVCVGKHNNRIFEFLEQIGIVSVHDTTTGPRSLKYNTSLKNKPSVQIKTVVVKPKDVYVMMQNGFIDAIVSFKDIVDNYPMDVKMVNLSQTSITTKIVVVGKKDFDLDTYRKNNKKMVIFSEYSLLTTKWTEEQKINAKILQVSGSAEGYLVNDMCDLCVVVCETGDTIKQNDLKIVDTLTESRIGLFASVNKYDYVNKLLG